MERGSCHKLTLLNSTALFQILYHKESELFSSDESLVKVDSTPATIDQVELADMFKVNSSWLFHN